MENLKKIEKELSSLIEVDKKNWTHFYILLKQVEEENLWKDKYKSYTQWVKEFCIKTKTHESIIWNRKKAGKVYDTYFKKQKEKGVDVAPIQDIKVSADSLVILDKINKYDEDVASKLVDKVINKEITKKDLREVYKSIRPEQPSRNPHSNKDINIDSTIDNLKDEIKVTANQIISTICDIEWLGTKSERKYFKSSFEQDKYRAFTEFPVFTGTSRKSRRMDMLITENITTKNIWDLNLHCIEIKVSKSDLINDTKYTEYTEFVDFMWLAIPIDLIEVAKQNKFKECGIIAIYNNKATIIEKAIKLDPLRKTDTLTNIALKLI
ncbi:MAG: MmcB family DNA repair protein [Clostridia bacterium]